MITEDTEGEHAFSCFTKEDYCKIGKALEAAGWQLDGGHTNFGETPEELAITLLISPVIVP